MKTFKEMIAEASAVHPMAVHVHPIGKGEYKVHAVGRKVNPDHVKTGDVLRSSHLDDLSDAGHKVKETKAPSTVKEENSDMPEANKKFKKGDSVTDLTGKHYAKVISVNHPMVVTTKGDYHHTKLKKDK